MRGICKFRRTRRLPGPPLPSEHLHGKYEQNPINVEDLTRHFTKSFVLTSQQYVYLWFSPFLSTVTTRKFEGIGHFTLQVINS